VVDNELLEYYLVNTPYLKQLRVASEKCKLRRQSIIIVVEIVRCSEEKSFV